MDAALKEIVSISFSLSVQVSQLGPVWISCIRLGGNQRPGLNWKDVAHYYLKSTSVVALEEIRPLPGPGDWAVV